ncbi:MAG TPA: hypothetical protein VGH89_04820 [Pseudonocardia sp.]
MSWPEPRWLAWMTCRRDGLSHAVSDRSLSIGLRTRCRVYRSLCGGLVFPRPANAPVGRHCVYCAALTSRPSRGEVRR